MFVAGSSRMSLRRLAFLVLILLALPAVAVAHPLGNFTTNHLTRLTVRDQTVTLRYVLDLAEIPTVALDRTLSPDGRPSQAQYRAWASAHAAEIVPALQLSVDGAPLALGPALTTVAIRQGAAGLHLVYLTATYRAALPAGARGLTYHDRTEAGRLGWRDVVLSPASEPTRELTVYPSALVGSPRARTDLEATIAGGVAHTLVPPAVDGSAAAPSVARSNALSDLLARDGSGPLFLFGALLLALGLGALHALEPGHGKTLLAVSLVGARATASQALILASSLTVAHTIGVLALGLVVLFATRWIVPESIYPWVTLLSGILVAVLGARALAAQVRRRRPVAHVHPHVHPHAHPHDHDHAHGFGIEEHHDHASLDESAHALAHAVPGTAPLTFRTAVFAAASGNIAPCPAALVVLLAAISLHRIGFGLTLIVAFSVGLAATLTTLGIAVVRGAAWLSRRPHFERVARYAPFASAGVIAVIGAVMLSEGLAAQGVPAPMPFLVGLTLLAIVGYAFALPHRHGNPGTARA
ncbi:MAG: hypothetical protein ABR508_11960 [Candidatus Baltobacteraceae bacterium]